MIIGKYLENPDYFVFPYKMVKDEKKRQIITYKLDDNGKKLRNVHEKILRKLYKLPSSQFSFAYKKHSCTKNAFKTHMQSNFYIKLDIKSFFESIKYDKFVELNKDTIKDIDLTSVKACFYKDALSLGYVTSPRISDLYLYKFDFLIEKYLKEHKYLHYSRYSDDILISSELNDFGELHTFLSFIRKNLLLFDLEINEAKLREFDLSQEFIEKKKKELQFDYYPAVKFLGLNLVRKGRKSVITISKRFIVKTLDIIDRLNKVCYEINSLKEKYKSLTKEEKELTKEKWNKLLADKKKLNSIVHSRVSYIKYNSKESYKRFKEKYQNKYNKKWS